MFTSTLHYINTTHKNIFMINLAECHPNRKINSNYKTNCVLREYDPNKIINPNRVISDPQLLLQQVPH